nr:MAG TPA: hypothetical protein [Caudoviricetes sp.]DAO31170.1 MAG TPA: hypothetical protein [Crassvirales sp.]
MYFSFLTAAQSDSLSIDTARLYMSKVPSGFTHK